MQKTDDLPRGQLSTIILQTLLDSDKYGYEIINEVAEKSNGKIAIKQPSLYSCLRRMEEQALISSYWRDSEIGGRRHYYRITDYGKKYVEKWQVDILSYSPTNRAKTSSNDSPTFLEQTNLFEQNTSTLKVLEQNQEKDNSFIQYDLFANESIISKPSVEVFETVKDKQQSESFEHDESISSVSQDDRIAQLRNTILENNKSQIEVEPVNIKQEFMLLKHKQKSFTESYKEEKVFDDGHILDELELTPPQSSDIDTYLSTNNETSISQSSDDSFETTTILNYEQTNNAIKDEDSVNSYDEVSEPIFVDLDDEMPTIFKSTTEFKDDISSLNSANIELNEEIEDNEHSISTTDNDSVFLKKDEIVESKNNQNTNKPKDDAVFITEKPDPETTPKVKRIAPNKFEHFNNYNQNQVEDKILQLYKSSKYVNQDNAESHTQSQHEPEITEQPSEDFISGQVTNHLNYKQLAQYYNANGINFSAYQKLPKNLKTKNSTYIKHNKFNVIHSLSMLAIVFLETLICGIICSPKQPALWFMYFIPSIVFAGVVVYYCIVFYKNRNKLVSKSSMTEYHFISNSVFALIGILVVFSINLLCGMGSNNIANYATSFIYISILMINFPLYSLCKYVLLKTKVANA